MRSLLPIVILVGLVQAAAADSPKAFLGKLRDGVAARGHVLPAGDDCAAEHVPCRIAVMPGDLEAWAYPGSGTPLARFRVIFDATKGDGQKILVQAMTMCDVGAGLLSAGAISTSAVVSAFGDASRQRRASARFGRFTLTVGMDDAYPIGTCTVDQS